MKKVITLTESQLTSMIMKMVNEQSINPDEQDPSKSNAGYVVPKAPESWSNGQNGPAQNTTTPSTTTTQVAPTQQKTTVRKTGSDDVKKLQQFLKSKGYNVTVDGIMGPETQKAQADWNKKNGKTTVQGGQTTTQGGAQPVKPTTAGTPTNEVYDKWYKEGKNVKEMVVTIGKTVFKILIFGATIVYLIGKGLYKVGQAIHTVILRLLHAISGVIVSGVTVLAKGTIAILEGLGYVISKGFQYILGLINKLTDKAIAVAKWVITTVKNLGIKAWGQILVLAAGTAELGKSIGSWCKQQYESIAKQLGATWNQAVNSVKTGWNNLKQNVKSAYNDVEQGAKGFIHGLVSESLVLYYASSTMSTKEIINEMKTPRHIL